jgi:hypothetical protein
VVGLFLRWDVEWFLRIVRDGYSFTKGQWSTVAFFPLYPILVRCFMWLGLSDIAAGILVSNVALYVAAVLACRLWTAQFGSERIGKAGVVLLLVWPATFFHSTIYADALFLALLAGVMTAAREGRWAIAGVLGCLLALTRQIGLFFLMPLLLDAYGIGFARGAGPSRARVGWLGAYRIGFSRGTGPNRAGVGWLALVPCGTLGYCAFLWRKFGDPLAFLHTGGWQRDYPGIWVTFSRVTEREWLYRVLFVGTAVWLLVLILLMLVTRARLSDAVWCSVVWYTSAASGTLEAIPRLAMLALPIFGFTAALTDTPALSDKRQSMRQVLLAVSGMALALCTILFVNGYWMT